MENKQQLQRAKLGGIILYKGGKRGEEGGEKEGGRRGRRKGRRKGRGEEKGGKFEFCSMVKIKN